MNLKFAFLTGGIFAMLATSALAATATIKKAAPVSTQQTSAFDTSAGSLVGTALGLYSSIQEITKRQKDLTAECIPSSAEITFVNNVIKEWAKTGVMSATQASDALGMQRCRGTTYAAVVKVEGPAGIDKKDICFDAYDSSSDRGTIWENYPKASVAEYCSNGELSCTGKYKKTVSNMYDVFNLIDFTKPDYTGANEATMAAKILDKVENCSYSKLSARKRALWGEFLVNSAGSIGQKTNTGTIMQQVSGFTQQGGGALQGLGSLGSLATQFLDK